MLQYGCVQDFYEDIFEELDKYGEIENLNVCDNLADHMVGSVYVKFKDENCAARALQACLSGPPFPSARSCAGFLLDALLGVSYVLILSHFAYGGTVLSCLCPIMCTFKHASPPSGF